MTTGDRIMRLDRGLALRRRAAPRARTASRGPRRARGRGTRRAGLRPWLARSPTTVRPSERLVLGLPHRLDAQRPARRTRTSGPRVGDLGAHLVAQRRVAEAFLTRRGSGSVSVSRKRRHLVEQERRVEREVRALAVRREHRVDRRARRRAAVSANSRLRDQPSGACGMQRQRVEVHGPARRACHREDERAVVVVVAVEERARDELDRAAAELGEHRRPARPARRARRGCDGTPRPSCATCSSSWHDVKPIAPSLERGAHERLHLPRSRRAVAVRSDASSPIT